jgi:hypothetical protein
MLLRPQTQMGCGYTSRELPLGLAFAGRKDGSGADRNRLLGL